MTIDEKGRMTPRSVEKSKRLKLKEKTGGRIKGGKKKKDEKDSKEKELSVMEKSFAALCQVVKFRSKNPKIIDLTEEARMPSTLNELAVRCTKEEKDLYMYYYLRSKKGESMIIFSNSITCTKRISSILEFLKIKNYILHSKMQQRARLKSLDRFKKAVLNIESGDVTDGAILVCTDVAARGLDIPNVQNVLHYQSPFNAEIYVHRSGRTARIGASGESLALLAPEDERNFRIICGVLKKSADKEVANLDVKHNEIDRLRPIVTTAIKCEKTMYQEKKEDKSASWIMKLMKDADLDMDDNMKKELGETLGKKRMKMLSGEEKE
jgi:ATP-dependent RNA helicase DDX24/MAK5